jgi:hypothetical protein
MSTEEVPYQIAPQVEALQQERANCVAYGNKLRVTAIDRQLAEYGVKQEAAENRSTAAEEGGSVKTAQSTPPKGRRSGEKTEA